MAELTALQSVPGGQINSGTAQTFNPMQGVQILAQARQRQDQLDWHNKQAEMARQKAIADAKAKAAEDEVVAKFEVAQGDHFRQPVQEMVNRRIEEVKAAWPSMNKAQRMQAMANVDQFTKPANQFIASQDAAFKATRTKLGNDYSIPATVERDLVVDRVRNDPEFYKKDFAPDFERTITSNPAFFNWENVGQRIAEKAGTLSSETIYASGTGKKKKYSQFFTGKKDPNTGLPVIDRDIAMDLIETDASAKNMKDVFIAQSLPELQKQFPNMKPDELLKAAEGEAINKFFRGRGIYDVTDDLQSTAAKEANKGRGAKLADIEEVNTPIKINYKTEYTDGTSTITPINWGVGRSVRLKQPAKVGAGRKVFFLGGNDKKFTDIIEAGVMSPKQPDGSYILNFGFDVKEFQEPKNVLQLTAPTKFKDKNGVVRTRDKGGFISPQEADSMRKFGLEKNYKKVKRGFRLSPGSFQVDEDTQKLVGPVFQSLDVFIPADVGEVPELENVNPRKTPVTQEDDIDLGL